MSSGNGQSAARLPAPAAPVLTVTKGRPNLTELAVVTAVLLAAGAAAGAAPPVEPPPGSLWADRARLLSALPRVGARSWRASALPS